MLDDEPTTPPQTPASGDQPPAAKRSRRRAASRPAGPPVEAVAQPPVDEPAQPPAAAKKSATKATGDGAAPKAAKKSTAKKTAAKKSTAKQPAATKARAAAAPAEGTAPQAQPETQPEAESTAEAPRARRSRKRAEPAPSVVLFQAPDPAAAVPVAAPVAATAPSREEPDAGAGGADGEEGDDEGAAGTARRRRRRGGRGRRGRGGADETAEAGEGEAAEPATDEQAQPEPSAKRKAQQASARSDEGDAQEGDEEGDEDTGESGTSTRRRRRRRRRGGGGGDGVAELAPDDPERTVVHVRQPRAKASKGSTKGSAKDGAADGNGITSVKGSTRLEAKKQRRREGREQGRRRPPVLTEAEFLARREAVDRVMVVRQAGDRTQIGVLEDGVLVEHYVAQATTSSMVGSVYLGKVQNVLPSMEAAFVEVGRGRNAVLYAGEVNWDAAGLDGQPKRIEHAMKSGDSVLVQVTKDPIGHKGARLTAQVSLPGRYLVYVPDGSMTGISRKLPENERTRLKGILKRIVPDDAGVIVRTAAEGASEEELQRDVNRLSAQWADIAAKAKTASAPAMLYEEPDLTIRVVRDVFNEDFSTLVVSGDDAWDVVDAYVRHVAPDLADRLQRWTDSEDVFGAHRIDEQLAKALDRKVWLPSGGYLVIDSTEAMIVVDVNTGKFTGQGGNLEETVTKNNLEAAEEIVRQLRLRDIGGIVVIDFIDMVLESNRELVLRRLLECLGRDRTKHQVAEVTSLGLVQMTRKRVGQGLLDVFSTVCDACNGRGRHIHMEPVETKREPKRDARKAEPKKGEGRRTGAKRGAKADPAAADAVASDAVAEAVPEAVPEVEGAASDQSAPV